MPPDADGAYGVRPSLLARLCSSLSANTARKRGVLPSALIAHMDDEFDMEFDGLGGSLLVAAEDVPQRR